jgi:anthranilate synthase / indole-3-glycerol phosphate synthase / phosphoribosylanthranilate isomerase
MIRNFLKLQGGVWKQNPSMRAAQEDKAAATATNGHSTPQKQSILDKIYEHRKAAVSTQEKIPSQRFQDLQASYDMGLAPPLISFVDRLRQSQYSLALLAEVKRASPSKGDISLDIHAPSQAKKYALAGASCISVLTEPEWFKGSIEDLRAVRQSLEGMHRRPAVLRKEFIFCRYQILEARLAGADTVLLIVKMLDAATLTDLYKYSQDLGMEPLVEVQNEEEMEAAIRLGSRVIGVNNRNLTNFEVDLATTSNLVERVPEGTILAALSGISGPGDVTAYRKDGVSAVLVGEALMRAQDTAKFVADLLGGNEPSQTEGTSQPSIIKICGTRTAEAAKIAVETGATHIGIIRAPPFSRYITDDVAKQISAVVHSTSVTRSSSSGTNIQTACDYFEHSAKTLIHPTRARLVGVYVDQSLEQIISDVENIGLDAVQLHGSEPLEWTKQIPVPVIRRFVPGDAELAARGYHALPLLDAGTGTGKQLDIEKVKSLLKSDVGLRVILAGGLNPDNVSKVLESLGPYRNQVVGVDVSSGVESEKKQDHAKIRSFVAAAAK